MSERQCSTCGVAITHWSKTGFCVRCFPRKKRVYDAKRIDVRGYVVLTGDKWRDHPNFNKASRSLYEHTYVMAEVLGRPLLPGENVHHKNGVKNDNRPENLEVWTTHQPTGQRAEDLLEWADEIYRRYGGLR